MKHTICALLLLAAAVAAQTPTSTPTAPTATGPTYQYFGETGFGGSLDGLTSTTGFGLRVGSSQFFWVTDVDTTIGAQTSSSSTIRTGAEYHAALSGKMEFLGYAAGGVSVNTSPAASTTTTATDAAQTTNTVGLGNFQGGFGLSYDIGSLLSKGKFIFADGGAVSDYRDQRELGEGKLFSDVPEDVLGG